MLSVVIHPLGAEQDRSVYDCETRVSTARLRKVFAVDNLGVVLRARRLPVVVASGGSLPDISDVTVCGSYCRVTVSVFLYQVRKARLVDTDTCDVMAG